MVVGSSGGVGGRKGVVLVLVGGKELWSGRFDGNLFCIFTF